MVRSAWEVCAARIERILGEEKKTAVLQVCPSEYMSFLGNEGEGIKIRRVLR